MSEKEELYNHCKSFVEAKIRRVGESIHNIQEALNSDHKSSAGDKHETGRAMLQLEREKLGEQLKHGERMSKTLSRIDIRKKTANVTIGSLVRTSKSDYFIAISAGKFEKYQHPIYCISSATPIGQLLLGKSVGDRICFNGETINIKEVS